MVTLRITSRRLARGTTSPKKTRRSDERLMVNVFSSLDKSESSSLTSNASLFNFFSRDSFKTLEDSVKMVVVRKSKRLARGLSSRKATPSTRTVNSKLNPPLNGTTMLVSASLFGVMSRKISRRLASGSFSVWKPTSSVKSVTSELISATNLMEHEIETSLFGDIDNKSNLFYSRFCNRKFEINGKFFVCSINQSLVFWEQETQNQKPIKEMMQKKNNQFKAQLKSSKLCSYSQAFSKSVCKMALLFIDMPY